MDSVLESTLTGKPMQNKKKLNSYEQQQADESAVWGQLSQQFNDDDKK